MFQQLRKQKEKLSTPNPGTTCTVEGVACGKDRESCLVYRLLNSITSSPVSSLIQLRTVWGGLLLGLDRRFLKMLFFLTTEYFVCWFIFFMMNELDA